MHGVYSEDSNIIDFNYIKLMQLAELYASDGREGLAEACYNALDLYLSGTVEVYFKAGEPYITTPAEHASDMFENLPEE